MAKAKKQTHYKPIGVAIVVIAGLIAGYFFFHTPDTLLFQAPGRDFSSPKKVEDYFLEALHMTPQEAKEIRWRGVGNDGTIDFRINKETTLDSLISNLTYYGFVRSEKSLRYALEHTEDTTVSTDAIHVGTNGSIDKNAEYRISEDMSAWQIADILLNNPSGHFPYDEYGYLFMP